MFIFALRGKLFYDYAGKGKLYVDVIFGIKYYLRIKTFYDMYIWEKKQDWVKELDDLNNNGIKGEANVEIEWIDENKNGKKDKGEVTYKNEWHNEYKVVGGEYVFDEDKSSKGITEISDYQDDFNNLYKTNLKRVKYTSNDVPVVVNGFYSVNYIGRNYRSTSLKMDALPETTATLTYK